MPKSSAPIPSSSSAPTTIPSSLSTDDQSSRNLSDIALRKKKNADAQAAFRARRANYIATLEETVTSLESVVLQLQESCRESRHEVQQLKHENARLRHELRERDKFCKSFWHTKKQSSSATTDVDDPSTLSPPFPSPHPAGMNLPLTQYPTASDYRIGDDSPICGTSFEPSSAQYHNQPPPSLTYSTPETDGISESASSNILHGHRPSRSSNLLYPIPSITRDNSWPSASLLQNASSTVDSVDPTHTSQSSTFVDSPALAPSNMSFVGRFHQEDQKVPLSGLDTAPYAFPTSRSISPTNSPPSSSSSTSLIPLQFGFSPNSTGPHRANHDYRRHPPSHTGEVTLHGGTADVSLVGPASDAVRYRLPGRHDQALDRPQLPALPPVSGNDTTSQQEHGNNNDGDNATFPHSRTRTTRSRSRSSSPNPPILSGTLAVIKAQAFGALRRTRTRAKKSSEGAAKVAMGVLEARGIGMTALPISTPSLKRQRLDEEPEPSQP